LTVGDYGENEAIAEHMKDKVVVLEGDKYRFVHPLSRVNNTKNIVETRTSFGISTIYLALAVTANVTATDGKGRVIS